MEIAMQEKQNMFWGLFSKSVVFASMQKDKLTVWIKSPSNAIFLVCILVYVLIRLIGLTDYPGYFTFDEAMPTTLAADFLRDGFRNYDGDLFPPFFQNINKYSLGTTVYIQLVVLLIFGRSAYIIRAASVLIGLIGAICVSLALRDIFHVKNWWIGILLLSVIPAWFHHSRTAYEMVTFVSCYSTMLYFYWMYRFHKPAYLYPAIAFAAFAFYAYAPGQLLVPLTIFALLILDFRYHFRRFAFSASGLLIGAIFFYPYVVFQFKHLGDTTGYLQNLESYWVQNIPITEKISIFLGRYFSHLNPVYWFAPAYDATSFDGLLHIMKGYGHLGLWLIPILAWGLLLLLSRLREPQYQTLFAVLLIAPVGASMVLSPSSITRALVMVIPVALIASIGLDDLVHRVAQRLTSASRPFLTSALLIVLLSVNFYMLWDVLHNGISWFDQNQADGSQFGANQVFTAVQEILRSSPNADVVISPNWMMNGDVVARVYLDDTAKIRFHSLNDFSRNKLPITDNTVFVVTPDELAMEKKDPKFSNIQILKTIPYSASKDGFYLIHLHYSPNVDELFAAEIAERHKLISGEITINQQKVKVAYSQNNGTDIQAAFDDDPISLYKTDEVNPAIFDLTFPKEQEFRSVSLLHGTAPVELHVAFFSPDGTKLDGYDIQFKENIDREDILKLDTPVKAVRVLISVTSLYSDEAAIVHIWGIYFNK